MQTFRVEYSSVRDYVHNVDVEFTVCVPLQCKNRVIYIVGALARADTNTCSRGARIGVAFGIPNGVALAHYNLPVGILVGFERLLI